MRKISILSLHLGYGGIEKSIVSLANILCERYDVEIAVCYNLYGRCVFTLDPRVSVVYLNDSNIKPNPERFKNALHHFRFFQVLKEGFFSLKVLFYRKKKMVQYIQNCNSDVIISTRDIFNEWLSSYGKKSAMKIGWEHNHFHDNLRYADRIVSSVKHLDYFVLVSSELQKYYNKRLSHDKCKCIYIPNCIDFIPDDVSKLKNKRFISVGRLSPEKGYLDLLKVFFLIHKKYPDWTLDIIGDGVLKSKMEDYIKEKQLSSFVTLHGFQEKDFINHMLHDSSIYLMTSYTESFGIVLIEAMSHGIPCVAMDSAEGAREIIDSGRNGFLIKNRNYDMMVKVVGNLIQNPKKRIEMGKCARESITKYTADVVGDEWFKLLEKSDGYES